MSIAFQISLTSILFTLLHFFCKKYFDMCTIRISQNCAKVLERTIPLQLKWNALSLWSNTKGFNKATRGHALQCCWHNVKQNGHNPSNCGQFTVMLGLKRLLYYISNSNVKQTDVQKQLDVLLIIITTFIVKKKIIIQSNYYTLNNEFI